MSKIIAVTGATGAQGGGVVKGLKATSGWTVRAVTRNPQGEAAKKLSDEGIEVVQADFDDEASLEKAFEVNANSSHPPHISAKSSAALIHRMIPKCQVLGTLI